MAYSLILQGDAETVLASVNDFLKIDKERESFEIAYRFIASRKKINWSHDYEKLMIVNIDLALKLNKPDYIPENLINFRNNAQTAHVGSIDTVFNHYIQKMEDYFQKCLDQVENPEAMFQEINEQDDAQVFYMNLLNTQEGKAKEKFKSAWRLLASAYKTVVELTSKNLKLEDIYVRTVKHVFEELFRLKAFNDFKNFCTIVKGHQQTVLSKADASGTAGHLTKDLSNYETNRKLYELRIFQLGLCKQLDFMQEAFQVLEDINVLLTLCKRRAEFYINYYQNLAEIFLSGGFYLFHAVSLGQVFSHLLKLKGFQTDFGDEATRLVLAALSINSNSEEFFLPESLVEKYEVLLGVSGVRKSITNFLEETARNVLIFCPNNIKQLYNVCTGQTDIYEFSSDIERLIGAVDPKFDVYKKIIVENCVYIVIQMLSKFYSNVTFDELKEFTHFIEFNQVKKMIAKMKLDKHLNISMNYEEQVLEFKNNYYGFDSAISSFEKFAVKLRKVAWLLEKKQSVGQPLLAEEKKSLQASLLDLFQNGDPAIKEKEARIMKELAMASKEPLAHKRDAKRDKGDEEERHRLRLQKEHAKNQIIERKMLQVKKAKVNELIKIDPRIKVLGIPLINFSDEDISQLDFSIFLAIQEDIEKAKNEAINQTLERKYKIYDFYQRELFKIYHKQIDEQNNANEIDLGQIEEQIANISAKKQQMQEVVKKAEAYLNSYKNRTQAAKEKTFNEELLRYKQEVTSLYRDSIMEEAEKLYKAKLAADQQPNKPFQRKPLVGDSSQSKPQGQDAAPPTLSRAKGWGQDAAKEPVPPKPTEMKLAKRGEALVQAKTEEPIKVFDGRGVKKDATEDKPKKPEEAKPVLTRQGFEGKGTTLQKGSEQKIPDQPSKPQGGPKPPAQPAPVLTRKGANFEKK